MIRESHRQPHMFQPFGVLAGGAVMECTGSGTDGLQPLPKRHACHCGKSFLRKEHLRRHQASHGEPGFVCPVCKRSFTRSDLLRRHVALHDASAVPDFRRGRACDACHSNKTKCDGGPQCSLCAKRRISCTYNRVTASSASDTSSSTNQANPLEPMRNPSASSSPIEHPGISVRTDTRSAPAAPASLQAPPLLFHEPPMSAPPNFNAPRESSVNEVHREANIQAATAGLRLVLKQVTTSRFGQSPSSPKPESSPEVRSWLTASINTYFAHFHERWPLLHGPTFDPGQEAAETIATMAIIGSWFNDDKITRNLAVEIHNNLVQHLLEDILRVSLDQNVRWPLHTYQSALLNIIFAIETGREYLIPKARLLHSLLLTALRGQNVFSSEALAQQQNTYYPGDFVPWVVSTHERWKRLAALTFKVDSYLCLLTNEVPTLRLEELGIGLSSTWALWNAYGLDVFFRRWPCEPYDRAEYKMSDLATSTLQHSMPSVVLIEDIQYSLLGMLQDTWTLSQTRRSYGSVSPSSALLKDSIFSQLQFCKDQLNRTSAMLAHAGIQTQLAEGYLSAYSGKEEPGHPNWREAVRARISAQISTATVLYHLMNLHMYADIQTIRAALSEPTPSEMSGAVLTPLHERRQALLHEWASSIEGRAAVAHAFYCLGVYEQAATQAEARRASIDPILHTALATSAAVVWIWASHMDVNCNCSQNMMRVDHDLAELGMERSVEMENWTLHGSPVALQGIPICPCSKSIWMVRFMAAFSRGAKSCEIGGGAIIVALRSKLQLNSV